MVLVTGDAGHGLYTPGKRTPDDEREWSFNDKVIRAFEAELNNYEGVTFKRLDDPTGQTDVPLQTRTDKANALGSRVHVSFHHNANAGTYWGDWGGVETYVYKTTLADSMALAKAVHSKNVNAYGLRDRGIKASDLHMVRETAMTAILTEGGFMDSTTDIGKLRDNNVLRNSGIAIAQGVAEYLGLKRKTAPVPTEQFVYFTTGGFTNGQAIEKFMNFVRDNKFGTSAKLDNFTLSFTTGDYSKGGAAYSKMKGFMVDNGIWYQEFTR
ncbi:N-acetylmuramoyl-L-alanine amidase [Bacillus phage vB_BcM_Sam112]|uniref:N-acetylmuramoyl-L-alanine amidase n=1 Tax=Bacillus phage vB_BcM_Sam112 TaxID=2663324 RepID=A0A5Q2F3V6_9CAUD|nr:N-acetylmuramoyl-L-alanine amidase [Bacillus phage vB_BcM_Sam112]